jgi:hypothetical protein
MPARRLRAHIRSLSQLPRWQCTPAHQLQQHRCSGGLGNQIRGNSNAIIHANSILLFL